jgi:transcriptional regulator with XRE-family HTH domain
LKRRLKEKEWSDSDLARATGVSSATVGRWKTGENDPPFETLDKIAAALGTTAGALISGTEDIPPLEEEEARVVAEVVKATVYAALRKKPKQH